MLEAGAAWSPRKRLAVAVLLAALVELAVLAPFLSQMDVVTRHFDGPKAIRAPRTSVSREPSLAEAPVDARTLSDLFVYPSSLLGKENDMSESLSRLTLAASAALLLAQPLLAGGFHGGAHNVSMDDDDRFSAGCKGFNVRFDDADPVRDEETFSIPASSEALRISSPEAGGIRVQGWDGADYSITACKAAPSRGALASLRVERSGRTVSARTGGGDDGLIYFLVKAPRNAVLEIDGENGPMSVANVSGRVSAKVENGPLSLKNVNGKVVASAENGPISVRDGSGDYDVRSVNGPLSLRLSGSRWEGGELVAKTENGPLDVRFPEGYGSGVRVEASAWVPISCRAAGCPEGLDRRSRRDSDGRPRTIELGSGTPTIHLSATNGPVTIKSSQ